LFSLGFGYLERRIISVRSRYSYSAVKLHRTFIRPAVGETSRLRHRERDKPSLTL
jgi:hypothetical protein